MNYLKLKPLALAIGLIIVTDMAVADTWNSTSIYTKGDQIEYQSITYIAQWWTKDEAPSASNTGSLWLKVTDPNVNEEYSNSTSYHADDRVVYQGNTFKAQWFTINTTPDASEDPTTPWVNPWELTTVTTAPATLISSTTPVNNAPIAQDDSESTNENTGVTINVLANDSDAENDALTLNTNSLTQPSYGSIEVITPGIISYTPDADITTTVVDTFTYTVTDGSSDSNSATVSVTVIATETPVLPVSNTYPQYPAGMTYEAGDIVSNNGNLYQCKPWPYTGWCSRETSAYEPGVGTHWTEAWAIVSGTTSAPLADNAPQANNDSTTAIIGLTKIINVLANDADENKNTLSIANLTTPVANGTASGTANLRSDRSIDFTVNVAGTSRFSYTIKDAVGQTSTATVSVNVLALDAKNDSKTIQAGSSTTLNVLDNDLGKNLIITNVDAGTKGTITYTDTAIVYTPNDGVSNIDTLSYTATRTINNINYEDTATITLDIQAVALTSNEGGFNQDSGKVVGTYFVEWGVYGRDFHVKDIDAENLTHILFGFLSLCAPIPNAYWGAITAVEKECANKAPYEVTMVDSYANLERAYAATDSVNGIADSWYGPGEINPAAGEYNGSFKQFRLLKEQYPHLRILPSVGGWTMSTPFFAMANDSEKRATFVESVKQFIRTYPFFDGIDIDWEYPVIGGDGNDKALASPADRDNYTVLMSELRTAMNELGNELTDENGNARYFEVTAAVGAGKDKIDAIDYNTVEQYMDYIFMMTYDFAGGWDATTGHHAAVYSTGNSAQPIGFSTYEASQNFISAGVPPEKLVVGAAFYGRGWQGVAPINGDPVYAPAAGAAPGTWEPGVFDFFDIVENYLSNSSYTTEYDNIAEAPYVWSPTTGIFITYENERSIAAKGRLLDELSLGGIFSWELDGDAKDGRLLDAMNHAVGNSLK